MAAKKNKPKPIQFQIGWPGLIAIVISTVCVLLWTFVLGFWMGQKVFNGNGVSRPKTTVVNPQVPMAEIPMQQAEKPGSEGAFYGNETSLFDQNEKAIEDLKERLKQEEPLKKQGESMPTEVIGTPEKEKQPKTNMKPSKAEKKESAKRTLQDQPKKAKAQLKVEKVNNTKREELKRFFSLQIASYKDRNKARKERARWEKKGYYVQVKKADLGRRGIWYRVLLGKYKNLDQAKKAASKLASKEGIRSYVVKGGK